LGGGICLILVINDLNDEFGQLVVRFLHQAGNNFSNSKKSRLGTFVYDGFPNYI
jgi:hypothetical protein